MPALTRAPDVERPHLPHSAAVAAFAVSLALAWLNLLLTGRWAAVEGALHGWRLPWYAAALAIVTVLFALTARRVGSPARVGRIATIIIAASGIAWFIAALVAMLPVSQWNQIPFRDDWTVFFQQSVNGGRLLRHGSLVGWNWWMLGGYPTSTDIAENFAILGVVPMTVLGDRIGFHVLHVGLFLSIPAMLWWDLRQEDDRSALLTAGLCAFFLAGCTVTIGKSGDTNSLAGLFSATVALVGSRGARLGRRWGGPVLLLGLVLALYTHEAFFVYAVMFLGLEALYFGDWRAAIRLAVAAAFAGAAAIPMHWESFRYHAYVSFNNMVFDPRAPTDWPTFARLVFYNVQILGLPGRWFNDYRSLANIWLPVLLYVAIAARGRRAGFYAAAAVLTQFLLRFNTPIAGAGFDRIQHVLPVLQAPAYAGCVLLFSGSRRLALALVAAMALFIATSWTPVKHVRELREFDPPLIDRISAADGMVLVEHSPHRDMDADPQRRSPTTPFPAHFEGLLPGVAGQRFYAEMIDGWVWNIWRGQVVGAGTFNAQPISFTAPSDFAGEMRRWGVGRLFVWTDASRAYLSRSDLFIQRWRGGVWSEFELQNADLRSVVTSSGSGSLRNLTLLGGDVDLTDVTARDEVVVRSHYYPVWRAFADGHELPVYDVHGQLAFHAPRGGSYAVHLTYPRYLLLTSLGLLAFALGAVTLASVVR